jgi:hypothetical protein
VTRPLVCSVAGGISFCTSLKNEAGQVLELLNRAAPRFKKPVPNLSVAIRTVFHPISYS